MRTVFASAQQQTMMPQPVPSRPLQPGSTGNSGVGLIFRQQSGASPSPATKYFRAGKGIQITGLPGNGLLLAVLLSPAGGLSTDANGRLTVNTDSVALMVKENLERAIEAGEIVSPEEVPSIVIDTVEDAGYSKIAISPFGFNLDQMTLVDDGEYNISVPGFVFEVENDVTGTVVCDIEHQADGNSLLTFVEFDPSVFGDNKAFTAYALTNSDGTIFPVLPKTII